MASGSRETNRVPTAVRPTQEEIAPRRVVTLHLQQPNMRWRQSRHVSWDSGVREHPNQHVSKSCCIFHKKKLFGESSSDESSSTSDSDNDADRGPHGPDPHAHEGGDGHSHSHGHGRRPQCTKEHCYCGTRFH